MSEVRTESTDIFTSELKGDSRLIVLLGSPEGIKGVSKKLASISDFTRVSRGLFIVQASLNSYTDLVQSIPTISFVRTREIPGIKTRDEDKFVDRAFSIVSYKFNNPTPGQKKKVERLIRKSTCIRLRPSVLLFPVLRSKERRKLLETKNGEKLLDSRGFSNILSTMGATTIRWSRIKLANPSESTRISQAVERTLNKDLQPLETKLQKLREMSKNPEINTSSFRKKFTIITRRYKKLKLKWLTTKPIWAFDSTKRMKRIYNMLLNLRRIIDDRE